MNLFKDIFNAAIAELQAHRGETLSDRELAKTYGGSPSNISRWRKGQVENEGAETLLRILQALPAKIVGELLFKFQEIHPIIPKSGSSKFQLGGHDFTTSALQLGIGVFGGVGTGKTLAILKPTIKQLVAIYNQEEGDFAKIGGLILDPQGDLFSIIIEAFVHANRPLSDLIVVGPNLAETYNPIDPNETALENAQKLGRMQKILNGTQGGGDNKFWEDTCQAIIGYFLQLVEAHKPKGEITLHDLSLYIRNDETTTKLCNHTEQKIEEKKEAGEMDEETYQKFYDAITHIRNCWLNLSPNTKSVIKTSIDNMLAPISTNPTLRETFCKPSSFSFKDAINQGKIVVYHDNGQTAAGLQRMICRGLYYDFQTWAKRRNGSASQAYGLDTHRSLLFLADEFQDIAAFDSEGDQNFAGITRSARVIQIIAAQSLCALQANHNKERSKSFIQNISTWITLRSTDKNTVEWAKYISAFKRKEIDISQFQTVTPEKSKSGPWYSEGLIYHPLDDYSLAKVVKFPLEFNPPQIRGQIEEKTQRFLSALVSCAVTQSPRCAYNLEMEECHLADLLKIVRQQILKEFPEIHPQPEKEPRHLSYRMLAEETIEKPISHDFDSYKTILWAANSNYPVIYTKIREELQKDKHLPDTLKEYLYRLKNHDLQKVFQTILLKAKA